MRARNPEERRRAEAAGRRGERIAGWWLRLRGWRILDRRGNEAVLFGRQHVLQLPPPTDQGAHRPRRRIWQRAQVRSDGFPKVR